MLMAAEAINLYIKLVIVLGDSVNFYALKAGLISWSKFMWITTFISSYVVLPVFIVLFSFAPDYRNYYQPHYL